ncbi:hypothetical protein QFZ23_003788 [Arthrobacter globiformis]|uniref:hypothetical protein n=1 Tax=Arthrobacter globiformis TaxID=1665 RepID=UPI002782BAAA|nr:hypothetical protein [Arthrobacter globiformis]MDQ1059887.1 hypothetical protein [Arthrobacter globiformis]
MAANSTSSTEAPRVPRAGLVLLKRSAIRCTAIVASLLMAALVGAPGASAFWKSVGLGTGSAVTGSLAAPTGVTAPATNVGAVPVSWTASAGAIAPTGYYVTRITGSATAPACGSSPAALLASASCTDNAVPVGTHSYVVTAVYRSWTAVSLASGNITVVLPASNQLAFTQGPSNATAGAAVSPAVTVTVRSSGLVPVANVPVTLSIGNNPGSGTLSGTVTASTNVLGVATFANLSIDKAGSGYSLTASSSGLTPISSGFFNITPAAAKTLQFTTAPVSGAASASANLGPISVQRLDAYGNLVTAGDLAVGLSSTTAGTGIFSATVGGPAITTVTIPNGSSAASFRYGDTKAGTPTLTASSTGLAAASQTATITAGTATKLAVLSAPVTGAASDTAILGPITVQRQDAYGNPATAGSTTLLLSSSSGTSFFAASSAGAPVSQVTIDVGSSVTSVYYGDTKAGSPTITVSNSSLGAVTQTETVVAGAASQLAFETGPTPVATINQPFNPVIRVLMADTFGNPSGTGSVTISTNLSTCKLSGTTIQQAVSGLATFTGLQPQGSASNCRLIATSGTLTATSNAYSDSH